MRYNQLCKVVKALVNTFHGAQVRSTFLVLSRIIIKQTATLINHYA